MRRIVKVKLNDREVEALLIEKLQKKIRKENIKGREYRWEEYYLNVYIPKAWANKKFLIIPID